MSTGATRNTASSPIPAILAVSVLLHALVVFVVADPGKGHPFEQVKEPTEDAATATAEKPKPVKPMNPTCVADVLLATGARMGACATPLAHEAATCLADARERLSLDLLGCNQQDPPPAISLLEDKVPLSKIKPMPILPLLKKAKQKKFEKKQAKKLAEKHKAAVKREMVRPPPSARIVEITRPDVEIAPTKTRNISEFNSRVKQETVARGSTEKMVERPGPKELKSSAKATKPVRKVTPDKDAIKGPANDPKVVAKTDNDPNRKTTVESKVPKKADPGLLSMRNPRPLSERTKITPGIKTGSTKKLGPGGIIPRKGTARRRVAARTEDPARRGVESSGKAGARKRTPNLQPSKELLRRVVGGGSVDDLQGVRRGDRTALNSRRWKHANFFNRLKRQVAQNWHPGRVYAQRDPQGNVYGTKDRITVLRVWLHKDGSVQDIAVIKPCGVGFLDDEAARAFRAAAPFPNPPPALVNKHARIEFSFGFHFQIGSRRDRWRIFRYR